MTAWGYSADIIVNIKDMIKKKKQFIDVLKKNKIKKKILDIMSDLDRVKFFEKNFKNLIYRFDPIPIGHGEKCDDPLILAKMVQLLSLKKKFRVLEVGTGSGYSTAIIASIAGEVVSIDFNEELAKNAKMKLQSNGFNNVKFFSGDITKNFESLGTFDAIAVFAGCVSRPIPLVNILNDNGLMVFPMGTPFQQQVTLYKNDITNDSGYDFANFSFYDFCKYDSIRGIYGWVDQTDPRLSEDSYV